MYYNTIKFLPKQQVFAFISHKPGSGSILLIHTVDPNKKLVGFHSFFPLRFSIWHYCIYFSVGDLVSKRILVPAVCNGMHIVSSTLILNPFSLLYGLSQKGMPYARISFVFISEWYNLDPQYSASFIIMI